jgi:hypothetical protein
VAARLASRKAEVSPPAALRYETQQETVAVNTLTALYSPDLIFATQVKAEVLAICDVVKDLIDCHFGNFIPLSNEKAIEALDRLPTDFQKVLGKLPKQSHLRGSLETLHNFLCLQQLDGLSKSEHFLQIRSTIKEVSSHLVELDYPNPEGAWIAGQIRKTLRSQEPGSDGSGGIQVPLRDESEQVHKPSWDKEKRILTFKGRSYRYIHSAINQVHLLDAFSELNWPPTMDDPLKPRKLADTLFALNETMNRENVPLRFTSIAGKRVEWGAINP